MLIKTLNPPKDMTPRQVARWLALGRKVFAKNQAAEQAKAEALARTRAATEAKAARIAAVRNGAPEAPKMTVGGVASFLWLPQINFVVRGLGFILTLLVQMFVQTLASVSLLPPDHPALTARGAKSFRVSQILEEARLNLPPIRLLWDRIRTKNPSNEYIRERIVFSRQYLIFSSVIGSMFIGGLTIVIALSHVLFGAAHAFAQSLSTSGTNLGGNIPLPAAGGDLGSTVIDSIFGTGTAATSIVGSGLGAMLAMYSNMVLVFAGIIVLWIIISSVAETARSGIPFGKSFNHIWAPVRLVVALGLLVPLSSGLNSGQWIALSLAKWGSLQATHVWSSFATNMIAPPNANGQVTSGLTSIPYSNNQSQQFADNMLQVALCQAVNNAANPTAQITQQTVGAMSVTAPEVNVGTNGTTPAPTNTSQKSKIVWQNANVNCGSLTLNTTPVSGLVQQGTGLGTALAAAVAEQNILQNQINNSAILSQNVYQNVAQQIVSAAQSSTCLGLSGTAQTNCLAGSPINVSGLHAQYQSAINSYLNAQASGLTGVLNTYNGNLTNGLTQTAQAYGWMYAPVWLSSIATANGNVASAAQTFPVVVASTADQDPFTGDQTSSNLWNVSNSVIKQWNPQNVSTYMPDSTQQYTSIANALANMTSQIGSNPMVQAGTYGSQLLTLGFEIIEPMSTIDCYQNPYAPGNVVNGKNKCQQIIDEVQAQQDADGTGQIVTQSNYATITHMAGNGQSGRTFLPDQLNQQKQLKDIAAMADDSRGTHGMMYPMGMIMISVGFLLKMLPLIPLARFVIGILGWLIMVFEAVLAAPLMSLNLLRTDGEGFSTQQFTTGMQMLLGVIIRPILMTIGLAVALIAFNNIMQILNLLFAPTIQNLNPASDNSYVSLGVYVIFYATTAYTLANSAFKAIDMLPNFVMGWIGQRMESRVDDASVVQQQASGYMQTMAYSARSGGGANIGASSGTHTGAGGQQVPNAPPPDQYSQMHTNQATAQKAGFMDSSGNIDRKAFDNALSNPSSPHYQAAQQIQKNDPTLAGLGGVVPPKADTTGGGQSAQNPNPTPPKVEPKIGTSQGGDA